MDQQLALVKPTPVEVMQNIFADKPGDPYKDNAHWVLFSNGTFFSFLKSECIPFDGEALIARALDMSTRASLCDYDNSDDTGYYPLNKEYSHPTFIVLSCKGPRIGWVIVGKTPVWPANEQQEVAVCYLGRTLYELDCKENKIVAASFEWSGA